MSICLSIPFASEIVTLCDCTLSNFPVPAQRICETIWTWWRSWCIKYEFLWRMVHKKGAFSRRMKHYQQLCLVRRLKLGMRKSFIFMHYAKWYCAGNDKEARLSNLCTFCFCFLNFLHSSEQSIQESRNNIQLCPCPKSPLYMQTLHMMFQQIVP